MSHAQWPRPSTPTNVARQPLVNVLHARQLGAGVKRVACTRQIGARKHTAATAAGRLKTLATRGKHVPPPQRLLLVSSALTGQVLGEGGAREARPPVERQHVCHMAQRRRQHRAGAALQHADANQPAGRGHHSATFRTLERMTHGRGQHARPIASPRCSTLGHTMRCFMADCPPYLTKPGRSWRSTRSTLLPFRLAMRSCNKAPRLA